MCDLAWMFACNNIKPQSGNNNKGGIGTMGSDDYTDFSMSCLADDKTAFIRELESLLTRPIKSMSSARSNVSKRHK